MGPEEALSLDLKDQSDRVWYHYRGRGDNRTCSLTDRQIDRDTWTGNRKQQVVLEKIKRVKKGTVTHRLF